QGALHHVVEGRAPDARESGAEGDIVVYGLRERVRLLEHHADAAAYLHRVDAVTVEVLPVVGDGAGHPGTGDEVVHPVEGAQQRRLAASARANEGGDLVLGDLEADVPDGPEPAVVDTDVLQPENGPPPRGGRWACRTVGYQPAGHDRGGTGRRADLLWHGRHVRVPPWS